VLEEIDGLAAQGVGYIYFMDEIFLSQRPMLEALAGRDLQFGIQTRMDLWKPDMIDLLGRAGCVSIEAGVESLTPEGRAALDKNCRMSTDELAERLLYAKRRVPFVQANLIKMADDDPAMVAVWREKLQRGGVWANDPVPLYPYPSSPDYLRRWGPPDDQAWERAHAHYLAQFERLSDIQEDWSSLFLNSKRLAADERWREPPAAHDGGHGGWRLDICTRPGRRSGRARRGGHHGCHGTVTEP